MRIELNAMMIRNGLIVAKKEIVKRIKASESSEQDIKVEIRTSQALCAIERVLDSLDFDLQKAGRCVACGNLSEKDACNKCKKRPCEECLFVLSGENICSECLTEDEFRLWVGETCPEAVPTLEWDEHPEGFEDPCFCSECRSN